MRQCFVTDKNSDYCDTYNDGVESWYVIDVNDKKEFNRLLAYCSIIENFTEFESKFLGKQLLYNIEDYSFENIKVG